MSAVAGFYRTHGDLTEPGRFAAFLVAPLRTHTTAPADLPKLLTFIQGIVIHSDWAASYGVTAELSRETVSVARRMEMAEAAGGDNLSPERLTPGTCRDFALMTCSALREGGVAARVRCGFATYFTANPFEDHWVCEYWQQDASRWALADAQLDALQREHLGIAFDPSDLPAGTFLNAGQAWRAWRTGKVGDDSFGHGEARGAWFLRVNLMRDLLALHKHEKSDWDSWRSIGGKDKPLGAETLAEGDRIAAETCEVGQCPPSIRPSIRPPIRP